MSEKAKMRPAVRLYIAANVAGALAIAVYCLHDPHKYPLQLVFFLLLLPARQLTLRATAGGPSLSVGAVFTVASFALLGPYGAICAIATTVWPELTTIRQPIAAMAEAAINLLLHKIRRPKDRHAAQPVDHLVPYVLVKRDSVAPPRKP